MSEQKAITRTERVETIGGFLEKMKPSMSAVMTRGMDVEKMTRMAITVISRNDRLLQCTNMSLASAIMECAQLSLYPDSTILAHAHLVPFRVKGTLIAQLIPGYRGLIELMIRSGRVLDVEPRPVYKADEFSYRYGLNKDLVHVPKFPPPPEEKAMDNLIAAYCIIRFDHGKDDFIVMSRKELERIRDQAPSSRKKDGPWWLENGFIPMCLKTTIRQASKYQALSPEVDRAVSLDETHESGLEQPLTPPPITIDADFTPTIDQKPEDLDSVAEDLENAVAEAEASGTITPPDEPPPPEEPGDDPGPQEATQGDTAPQEPETEQSEEEETDPLKELAKELVDIRGDSQGMADIASLKRSARIPEEKGLDDLTAKQREALMKSLKTTVELARGSKK